MTVESELKRIADVLEKVVIEVAKRGGETKQVTEKKTRKTRTKKAEPVVEETSAVTETEPASVDDLDGEVGGAVELESRFSAEDVKAAAKELVDSVEGREGFEKAQEIIKKLGAVSLKTIVPKKYSDAINLFRKAVAGWKK